MIPTFGLIENPIIVSRNTDGTVNIREPGTNRLVRATAIVVYRIIDEESHEQSQKGYSPTPRQLTLRNLP